jgi:hypothetical protein
MDIVGYTFGDTDRTVARNVDEKKKVMFFDYMFTSTDCNCIWLCGRCERINWLQPVLLGHAVTWNCWRSFCLTF